MSLLVALLACCVEKPYDLQAQGVAPSTVARVERALDGGVRRVTTAMGKPFAHRFKVVVAPHRADFDREAARAWKMPASDKWMVGAGTADLLLLLSPDAWKAEAVEHDGKNDPELERLVAHELTHTYHGQVCPKHDFDGMDEMGWFVEGLAVLVSGQLETAHAGAGARVVSEGRAPTRLADAWTGPDRYGVAGSIVQYVQRAWGKATVQRLMSCTTNAEALKVLGVTEDEFLRLWRDSVKG